MKRGKIFLPLLAISIVSFAFTAEAQDCLGKWHVLPTYYIGRGEPCKVLGLDSHRGVCQPGNQYETLCDDASGNRYKTCQGPKLCRSYGYFQQPLYDCTSWDFEANRPCLPGFINRDCHGTCGSM